MKDSLMYQGKVIQEHAGLIQGRPRTYVEELDAKIEKYMMALGDLEVRSSMPDANNEALLNEITVLTDSMLQTCAQFEQDVNDPLPIKQAQVYFREKTHPVLSKSYFVNRARTWPQGHQGDFMMLEQIYKNFPMSEGLGSYLDRYVLSTPLSVGVQERIVKMRDLLKEELIRRTNPKVLDVACGSCREVFELSPKSKHLEPNSPVLIWTLLRWNSPLIVLLMPGLEKSMQN
jgi:hypothetical protein